MYEAMKNISANARNAGRSSLEKSENIFAMVMIAPALVILLLLVVYPIMSGIRLSLFDYNLLKPKHSFLGLGNFIELLKDKRFLFIIWNTVIFAVIANTASTIIGLFAAILLNNSGKLTRVLRGLGYLPWITPSVVVVFVWGWIFSKNFSPINALLMQTGLIQTPLGFLGNTGTFLGLTMPAWSVLFVRTWFSFPFKMTMLLAALQSIPKEQYEAARIDGANVTHIFWHIIIPWILPVLMITYSISMIWNLTHFEVNALLTNGGPRGLTTIITMFITEKAFVHYRMGLASAAGVLVMILASIIGIGYILAIRKGEQA